MGRECLLEGGILARAYASYKCVLFLSKLRAAANILGKRKCEFERESSIGIQRFFLIQFCIKIS